MNSISQKTKNNWILDAGLFLTAVVTIVSGIYFLFIPSGGYQGGRNPWYGISILFERETWEWLHTWIGLGIVIVAIIHLLFHWKWVVSMAKRIFSAISGKGSGLNARGKYNLVVNITIGLCFFVCAISGIYFLLAGSSEGGRNPDPMFLFARGTWDLLHTWSSILFIAAVLLHFVIHWGWVIRVTRKVFGVAEPAAQVNSNFENKKKENKMLKKVVGTAMFVMVVGLLAFGGVTHTYAMSDTAAEEEWLVGYSGNGYGNEFGDSNGNAGQGYESGYGEPLYALDALPVGTLNQAENDALLYMYEEEKLARDIYTLYADLRDKPMFDNIAHAEQTHMDTVEELLERYDLAVPGTDASGTYVNADLQKLYDELKAQGSKSLADALLAGGLVEETDIQDLKLRLEQTDQIDIQTVFENLLNGSYNHLSAFASVYKVETGKIYVPQVMTQADFDAIAVEEPGTTQGSGRGFGLGGGRGRR